MGEDGFNYKDFLANMLVGKQKTYLTYSTLVDDGVLKNYFINTQNYKVNHNYNFIPNFMIDYKIKFFNRMKEEENNNYEKDTASIIQKELFKYTDSLPLCEYLSQQNITNFINLVSNYIEK